MFQKGCNDFASLQGSPFLLKALITVQGKPSIAQFVDFEFLRKTEGLSLPFWVKDIVILKKPNKPFKHPPDYVKNPHRCHRAENRAVFLRSSRVGVMELHGITWYEVQDSEEKYLCEFCVNLCEFLR